MGGRYAYFFFELYVRQALIHTFYRDNLVVSIIIMVLGPLELDFELIF